MSDNLEKTDRQLIIESFNFLDTVVKKQVNRLHFALLLLSRIERSGILVQLPEVKKDIEKFLDDLESDGFGYIKLWRQENI